jgi:hypothetical protein
MPGKTKSVNPKLLVEAKDFLWELNKWEFLLEAAYPELEIPAIGKQESIEDREWVAEVKRRKAEIYKFMGEAVAILTQGCADEDLDSQLEQFWMDFVFVHGGDD